MQLATKFADDASGKYFVGTGTSSWFWGIDNLGLYEINTPVINTQPLSQTVDAATPVTFTVVAASAKPLSYQWQKDQVDLANGGHYSGATTPTLTVTGADAADAGCAFRARQAGRRPGDLGLRAGRHFPRHPERRGGAGSAVNAFAMARTPRLPAEGISLGPSSRSRRRASATSVRIPRTFGIGESSPTQMPS